MNRTRISEHRQARKTGPARGAGPGMGIALAPALVLASALVLVAGLLSIPSAARSAVAAQDQTVPYPLDLCLICGMTLGEEPGAALIHEGRSYHFCSPGCAQAFERAPEPHIREMEAALLASQLPIYPLDTCLICEGPLPAKGGDQHDLIHGDRLIRVCSEACAQRFAESPEEHTDRLNAAVIEAQLDAYPLDTCVVAGGKLGSMGEPVNHVFANRLVRFCCLGCLPAFEKNPAAYLHTIDQAAEKREK